jgi:hypothetical protein
MLDPKKETSTPEITLASGAAGLDIKSGDADQI